MNKLLTIIFVAAFIFISRDCWAQKKQYQPAPTDWQQVLNFNLKVTSGQLNHYYLVLQNGGPDKTAISHKFYGDEIKMLNDDYQAVLDSLNSASIKAFNTWYKAGESKWAADTLAQSKKAKTP